MTAALAAAVPARRPKIALVLGSGGLKCVAAFGALKVLQREGVGIDMVVACSGGSFCAVWVAQGGKHADADLEAERFARGWSGAFDAVALRQLPSALLPGVFGFDRGFGWIDDARVNRAIADYVGEGRFDTLALPLYLVATDLDSGDRIVLSEGRLADAIRASVAIPLLLAPWPIGGRLLIDGGVSDPLPIDVAVREGADVIIAMGFEEVVDGEIGSLLQLVMHVKSVTVNHLLRSQYAFYSSSHHAEVIPLIPVFERRIGLRAMHEVPYLLRQGELAAEREMPYLRRLLQLGEREGG